MCNLELEIGRRFRGRVLRVHPLITRILTAAVAVVESKLERNGSVSLLRKRAPPGLRASACSTVSLTSVRAKRQFYRSADRRATDPSKGVNGTHHSLRNRSFAATVNCSKAR